MVENQPPRAPPLPLKNLGNTCYENSIVQCLFSLAQFMYDFEHTMDVATQNEKWRERDDVQFKIAHAFRLLYDEYTSRRRPSPAPSENKCITTADPTIASDVDRQTNDAENGSSVSADKTNGDEEPISSAEKSDENASSNTSPTKSITATELESRLNDLKAAVGLKSSQFNSTHQQDASEFFYHVIDSIQEYFQSVAAIHDEKNPVTRSFELELDFFVTCVKCGHRTTTQSEKIRTLPLAIPDDVSSTTDSDSSSDALSLDEKQQQLKCKQSTIIELTLQNALVNYFRDDPMIFKCSEKDCDSTEKKRKCMIKKLPEILFMTLARYSHTGQKNLEEIKAPFEIYVPVEENKVCYNGFVNDQQQLNNKGIDDDNKYQLVAVVCHLGPSLNAGHYTSFVYNQENQTWYSCDDDAVTEADAKQVEKEARRSGYCFFYVHKSTMTYPQQLPVPANEPPKAEPTAKETLPAMTKPKNIRTIITKALRKQLKRLTSGSKIVKQSAAANLRSTSTTSVVSSSDSSSSSVSSSSSSSSSSSAISSPSLPSLPSSPSSPESSTSGDNSDDDTSDDTSSSESLVYLGDLSERSANDRCITPGCKLFGDKETNYWLCAICFELQKQELQIYNSGQTT